MLKVLYFHSLTATNNIICLLNNLCLLNIQHFEEIRNIQKTHTRQMSFQRKNWRKKRKSTGHVKQVGLHSDHILISRHHSGKNLQKPLRPGSEMVKHEASVHPVTVYFRAACLPPIPPTLSLPRNGRSVLYTQQKCQSFPKLDATNQCL